MGEVGGSQRKMCNRHLDILVYKAQRGKYGIGSSDYRNWAVVKNQESG